MFMWRKRCPISVLDIGVEGYEEIIRWSSKYIKHSFPFVNCLCWRNEVEQRAFSASLSSLSQSCGWFAAFGHQLDQPGRGCSCGRLINSLQKPARAGKGASPGLALLYGWTLLVPLTLEELVGLLAPWGWEEIFMALVLHGESPSSRGPRSPISAQPRWVSAAPQAPNRIAELWFLQPWLTQRSEHLWIWWKPLLKASKWNMITTAFHCLYL